MTISNQTHSMASMACRLTSRLYPKCHFRRGKKSILQLNCEEHLSSKDAAPKCVLFKRGAESAFQEGISPDLLGGLGRDRNRMAV